jgi:putative hydrolase of the HAD superfamily
LRFNPSKSFFEPSFLPYMSFDSIHTISFDATGTLFDPIPSIGGIYAEVLHQHGVFIGEPELEMRFMAEFHKSRSCPMPVIDEEHEKNRWHNVIVEILGDDFSDFIFEDLWQTIGEGFRWKTKSKVFRTLTALKEAGFNLVLSSNWDKRLYSILKQLKLLSHFDQVFLSTKLGVEKPEEAFYSKIADELGVDPIHLLHVGNSPANDYKPALRSGWNALLLHNRIPHGMEPGTVLGSIDQLPEILQSEQAAVADI